MFMKTSLVGVFAAALFAAQCLASNAAEVSGGERGLTRADEVGTITISGRVVDAVTGAALAGATVSTMEVSVVADGEGRFTIPGVPQERDAMLNFRVVTEAGGNVLGCAFIAVPVSLQPVSVLSGDRFAVKVVETKGDVSGLEIAAVDVSGDKLEAACTECHRPNPCLAQAKGTEDWIMDTHLGGVEVTEKEFEETKARIMAEGVKPDSYPNLRFQDAHRHKPNVALAAQEKPNLFRIPELLQLNDGVANCDTCHSRHQPSEYSLFLRMDIASRSLLCRQCHK